VSYLEVRFNGIEEMNREDLIKFIKDLSTRWLAHDGLWFQAVEQKYGMDAAIDLDEKAWEKFTSIEAKRIMDLLGLPEQGGVDALEKALRFRLYAFINKQETIRVSPTQLIFRMNNCRVQAARERKNMAPFPCKSVGIVEYSGFAKTIDPRIKTRCLCCPPDEYPKDYHCAWEFTLEEGEAFS
jgi:hypothetical protein